MAKDQELLQAVKTNDLGAFRKLATKIKAAKTKKGSKKYNVNIQDEDGFTASHHASLTGSSEVVIGLIELESDINARDHKGMSPLHLAAWSGKVEVARLLVEAGAHVNASSDNGDTPLILACQHGNSDVAEVLLDRGCNSWSSNKNGESALDLACRFGHVHVVELLLKSKEVKSVLASGEPSKTAPPLHLASKTGHVEIVRMLLEADADINHVTSSGTCLHEAALYGKTDVVKSLLEWGIDSNARNDEGHTALDVVNLFTSSKASPEIKQLLKDAAAVDSTVYARAVRDHFNMLDSTALPFKTGDTIIILEQNQNERWKGKIQSGEKEKVGYFPGNFVRLTSPRRSSNRSGKRSPKADNGVVPKGSYEMIALASASPSEFQRNSPRLSSFGKKGARHRDDESEDQSTSPAPKKALVEPALPGKGLKAKKGSVKLGTGLQYVEVAVDKAPLTAPQTSSPGVGGNQTNNKTQYAEVLLPPNGTVQEVDECEELPQLPSKNNKKPCASNETEDIWVRNTPAKPPPSLPPKTRTKSDAGDFERPAAKAGRPPAPLPSVTEPAGVINPAGARRVATPELSRKGYEDMSISSESGGRATPPVTEDIWKPQPVNLREHSKQQPLAYENVSLPHRGKAAANYMDSMIISDIDQQGEGDDGYVVVNQPSKPTDARGYENVTPGAVTQSAVTPGARSSYENVLNSEYYVPMKGGIPPSSNQTDRTSTQSAGGEEDKEKRPSDSADENKDATGYEQMKSGAVPVNHQYVNIQRRAGDAGVPLEPPSQIPLKMRDYNALYDWLEKFKLTIYIDNFVKGGFDMTSVHGITTEDLTAINVTKTGHRKKILSESGKLERTTVFPTEKPKDIMTWLRLIGLEQYIPEFLDGGFDDMDFLQDMTLEDLVAIGVTKPGHQRKIWMAVTALKGEGDENGNVMEQLETIQTEAVEDEELTPQERKGYLETCLDGDDSGVSTDEVEPENARTDDSEMEFPPPPPFPAKKNVNEEPFVEDSSSAESEIPEPPAQRGSTKEDSETKFPLPALPAREDVSGEPLVEDSLSAESEIPEPAAQQVSGKEECEESPCESTKQDQQETPVSQDLQSVAPQTSHDEINLSTEHQEKDNNKTEKDISGQINRVKLSPSLDSEDDEPPPRPPPPMEDIDISLPVPVTNQNNFATDPSEPVRSVKDMVMKENDRIGTFSLDSTFQRPKKPVAPPPVKPKSFKKPPPPAVKPKPRKAASFSGSSERSSGEDSGGDRSPIKPLSPVSPVDRRSSTGFNSYLWSSSPAASPSNRHSGSGSGSGSVHSRSSSTSSQGSVESVIEEFQERRKSFEKPGRKLSAPERLNTSYEYSGGQRLSPADATRAEGELDEQIKQILRPRSREDLSQAVSTEPSGLSSSVPQIEKKTDPVDTEALTKEQRLAEDLMKDINNMLSDFSSELDSMFE